MTACVYILGDEDGKYYIGSTSDLRRRLKQHLRGHTQTSRRMKLPQLLFSQECATLTEARAMERRLKKLKRKITLKRS